ncbi:MAG: 16S rRNA (guanine(527)-N(7))-methyltransferase RsmG [Pseudomonadota bacterium]
MMETPDLEDRDTVVRAFDVSRETLQRLDVIEALLREWVEIHNLVGPRELGVLWPRHMADSLQLCGFLGPAKRIVDLGSGAGFPGLIIAAALPGVEDVTLIESVGKKCQFLQAAVEAADLPATVLQSRIETVDQGAHPADAVTARALAPLPKLLNLASPWLENGAIGVFPKGQKWQEELTAAREQWTFAAEVEASRTSPAARILKLSEVRGNHDHDTYSGDR